MQNKKGTVDLALGLHRQFGPECIAPGQRGHQGVSLKVQVPWVAARLALLRH